MAPRTFVRFVGTLWENLDFEPGVGWETPRIARLPTPDPSYQLELLDEAGTVLVARSPEVRFRSQRARDGQMQAAKVLGYVPLRSGGTTIQLRHEGTIVYGTELARARPEVAITRLAAERHGRRVRLTWAASHEKPLTFIVRYLVGARRIMTLARDLTALELAIDTDGLPGGRDCRLVVLATDGLRSAHALSDPFAVPDKPPRVWIGAPAGGDVLAPDQPFTLRGGAMDLAGDSLEDSSLLWVIDGDVVARGCRSALAAPLEPGSHEVALRHIGADGAESEARVEIRVAERTAGQEEWRRMLDRLLASDAGASAR